MLKKLLAPLLPITRTVCLKRRYVCGVDDGMDPGLRSTMLKNGMEVVTEYTHSQVACVGLFALAGPRYENVVTHGMAHLTEHLVYKTFRTIQQCAFEQSMFYLGAKLSVHTQRDMQVFTMMVPAQDVVQAVDIFYKMLTNCFINEASLEQARQTLCLEVQDIDNNPKKVVFDYLHETAFQGTPMARRVMGPSKNINCFDAAMMSQYRCCSYYPHNLMLVTSGCVNHDTIVMYCQERFGAVCAPLVCTPNPGPSRYTGSSVVYRDDSMPLAHVAVAFEAPGYDSPDYLSMLVAAHIGGSWDRSQVAGERRAPLIAHAVSHTPFLCDSYTFFYKAYRDVGLWGIYFVGDKMHLDDVWHMVQEQFMHICLTTTPTDLERGLNNARFAIAKERYLGPYRSCIDIGKQLIYTKRRPSYGQLCYQLSLLRPYRIKEVGDKYLYDRCPAVAAVGPVECLPDYTRLRAGMYWLRI